MTITTTDLDALEADPLSFCDFAFAERRAELIRLARLGLEAERARTPLKPRDAMHKPDCEHPRAPIWLCDCPRIPTPPATGGE